MTPLDPEWAAAFDPGRLLSLGTPPAPAVPAGPDYWIDAEEAKRDA